MTNNTTISVDLGKDVTYELMIERLGGYEKMSKYVKETLADLGNDVPYDTDCYQFETEISFQFGQLQKALLAYRRAHNIYEMDDYIIHDGELKVFAMWSTAIDGCAYIGYAYAEDGEMAEKDEFRHATDEEITAGRCLDQ